MSHLHIRIDDNPENSKRKFACGIGPELPPGDVYFHEAEADHARLAAHFLSHPDREPCPGCLPGPKPQLGTPISQLSGRPGEPGYGEFKRIGRTWGYE